jgi:hypothetical protein
VRPPHGRQVGVPQQQLGGGLRPPAAGICDPRRGRQGVVSAQGTLRPAAGIASVERDIGRRLEEDGFEQSSHEAADIGGARMVVSCWWASTSTT